MHTQHILFVAGSVVTNMVRDMQKAKVTYLIEYSQARSSVLSGSENRLRTAFL